MDGTVSAIFIFGVFKYFPGPRGAKVLEGENGSANDRPSGAMFRPEEAALRTMISGSLANGSEFSPPCVMGPLLALFSDPIRKDLHYLDLT